MIKMQLSPRKAQLSDPKMQLSQENKDWELEYFHDVVIKKVEKAFQKKTLVRIEEMFSKYRYTYTFNRKNIAECFNVSDNRASGILKTCMENGIITKHKNGVYTFSQK